jgi:hypothetical protein
VRTELGSRDGEDLVTVTAQLWLPEDFSINFNQRERIVAQLQHELDRKVDLNLRLQRTISVISEQDIVRQSTSDQMKELFQDQLRKINSSVSVDSLSANPIEYDDTISTTELLEEEPAWVIDAVLRGDPSSALTIPQLEEIEKRIVAETNEQVDINVEIISRIQLQTNPDLQNQQIKADIQKSMYATFPDIDISDITLKESTNQQGDTEINEIEAIIEVKVRNQDIFDLANMQAIKNLLQARYNRVFTLTIESIEIDRVSL